MTGGPVRWSSDFMLLDGHAPATDALERIEGSLHAWFVIVRFGGRCHYVFSRAELLSALMARLPQGQSLDVWLNLREDMSSQSVAAGADVLHDERPIRHVPSAGRYVRLDADNRPVAVAGPGVPVSTGSRGRETGTLFAGSSSDAGQFDEGTTPVRHPSIECAEAIVPGAEVAVVVDLLREPSKDTSGDPLALGELPHEWETLDIGVTLVSVAIDFDRGGRGMATIRRNAASVSSMIMGTVRNDLAMGDVAEVHAAFWLGTRCCGNARRSFVMGSPQTTLSQRVPTIGRMMVELNAERPDLTVYITMFDASSPGRLHWRSVTEPFDGLPARLDGLIDLGRDPGREAAALFKEFAELPRGDHERRIEAFGERLWKRAPVEFRDAYWALVDHRRRPLSIQFISDDPHLPWELMRPTRPDETHPPLALKHAVARWIGAYQGWLRNRLPSGELTVVAPRYNPGSLRLPKAEETAQSVVTRYGARAVPGRRRALLEFLERPPAGPVAMLYFTGHGVFNDKAVTSSAIRLENRESLSAEEVGSESVRLGERDGTVVFFNACEVGASDGALGEVGGWAAAFVSRHFRAFIAPLWAIDEEDAAKATQMLIEEVVQKRRPIGECLRELRQTYGPVSPTFYSYLLYGDVMARFDAPVGASVSRDADG